MHASRTGFAPPAPSPEVAKAREDERLWLARELHDEVAQVVTSVQLLLASARRDEGPQARAKLAQIDDLLSRLARQIQSLSARLRPPALAEMGLAPTVAASIASFQECTGIEVAAELDLHDGRLAPDAANGDLLALTAYRIVQEALTNTARHARASAVRVSLRQRGHWLLVDVSDDGVGIDPRALADPTHLGLKGILERAASVGGSARIEAGDTGGTRVSARLPIVYGKQRRRSPAVPAAA